MKKLLLPIVFILFGKAYSQTNDRVEPSMLKINFIEPGIEYEIGVTKRTTLKVGLQTSFLLKAQNDKNEIALFPRIEGQYRYYYNLNRRLKKEKNISNNSGNYFSLMVFYQFKDAIIGDLKNLSNTFFVGPLYGMQRTYKSGFNWGFDVGVGYTTDLLSHHFIDADNFNNDINPWGTFSVGWVIGGKKKKTTH